MKKIALSLIAALIIFSGTALAQENVADLKIDQLPVVAKAGGPLQFSFSAGNRLGPECAASISYWVEAGGERFSKGKDSVFLGQGAVEKSDASLLLPSSLDGIYDFFVEMQCNDANVLANKTIEVKRFVPVLPFVENLGIDAGGEGKQLEFSYILQSNSEEAVPIHVQERIVQNDQIIWQNNQNIPIAKGTEIKRLGPILPLGNYKLTIDATNEGETAMIEREFSVQQAVAAEPELPLVPGLALAGVAFFLLASLYILLNSAALRKALGRQKVLLAGKSQGHERAKSGLCIVESGSKGVLEEHALAGLLDEAKVRGKQRLLAMQFALLTPVEQTVRGFIAGNGKGQSTCETDVSIMIANNTDMNWSDVVVLAEIPDFVAESAAGIETEAGVRYAKDSSVARFLLPKIGAMQSWQIAYTVPKIVSQAEANSIPLPAVIGYKEGKRLVVTQVRVEKQPSAEERTSTMVEMIAQKEEAGHAAKKEKKKKKT